jgi:hypothetical protein
MYSRFETGEGLDSADISGPNELLSLTVQVPPVMSGNCVARYGTVLLS